MNLDEDQSREVVSLRPGVAAVFADGMDRPLRVRVPLGRDRERVLPGPVPPIGGRRVGRVRRRVPRGPRVLAVRAARGGPARRRRPGWAWLRVWADTLVLAHVADRPMPAVPPSSPRSGRRPRRLRECVLATVVDRVVGRRARRAARRVRPGALRRDVAGRGRGACSAATAGPAPPPGAAWVIPQIRWLHEMDRLFPPAAGIPDKRDPPAAGLRPARPGGRRTRCSATGCARCAATRCPWRWRPTGRSWTAILGDDDHGASSATWPSLGVGRPAAPRSPRRRDDARHGWLPVVLSWPARLVAPRNHPAA